MGFIKIGEIINTFGIKGELKVKSFSDFEKERYKKDSFIYLGEEHLKVSVKSFRNHKGFTLLLLNDYEDINLVEKFKGKSIYKKEEDIERPTDGSFFRRDLKGLDVLVNGKKVGVCTGVEDGLRNNYLRVKKDDKDYLVPFIKPFILNVSLEDKIIEVIDMEGLF